MGFLPRHELEKMGFAHLGKNVSISDKISFYGTERISIGDYTRIDDFCVISAGVGGITFGRNVHIAVFNSIVGAGKITFQDFTGTSGRVSIYSSSDDLMNNGLGGPTVPAKYSKVNHANVMLEHFTSIGAGSIILPGVTLAEGTLIMAMSLVLANTEPYYLYGGTPAKKIVKRPRGQAEEMAKYLEEYP